MLSLRSTTIALLLAGVASSAILAGGTSASSRPASGRWRIVHWNRPAGNGDLTGVGAISTDDVWAVGRLGNNALAEHWNGRRWELAATPATASAASNPQWRQLIAVGAVHRADVWAVGDGGDACTVGPLIEHWNGNRWAVTGGRLMPGDGLGSLNSISVVTASDIWAVGSFTPHGRLCGGIPVHREEPLTHPLVEHWNGHRWHLVTVRSGRRSSVFTSVAALSPTNVWAVGDESTRANGNRTLIEHWNGRLWSAVDSPHPGPRGWGFLMGISGGAPRSVWAVGYYAVPPRRQHTLVEHWNGSKWRQVASPNLACHQNDFSSVFMLSKNDGWAVGGTGYCGHPIERSITAHWNGIRWSLEPSQNARAYGTYLSGVVATSTHKIWAVGGSERYGNGTGHGVIERYRP